MTLTINLTAQNGAGINFNTFMTSWFADLTPSGFPYILGGNSQFQGDQIVLLDQTATPPPDTKAIILDGSDFEYYFAGHTLSGTLTKVRLATLGDSYNSDGSFDIVGGHIANVSTAVEISGLFISNPDQVRGDFHNVTAALMGGGHAAGGASDPTLLNGFVWAEAHNVIGSTAADTYAGTAFGDTVQGNGGNDVLNGRGGNDVILGGIGNDTLLGDVGNDTLVGDVDNDVLDGGVGNDTMTGGLGNDTFKVDSAADRAIEAANQGTDRVVSTVGYTLGANVEQLVLVAGNISGTGNTLANVLTGSAGNNGLNGGAGNDTLQGLAGNDVLDGGAGVDTMTGGLGNDTFRVDSAADRAIEAINQGTDRVVSTVSYTLGANVEQLALVSGNINGIGNALANLITGTAGNNGLNGGAGNDTLQGLAGNDVLDGGAGNDSMTGGLGNDTYKVDSAADKAIEGVNQGTDRVVSTVSYTLGVNVEQLALVGANISGTGNALANLLTGTAGVNVLKGLDGNDVIDGLAGNDSLDGGTGNDVLTGGAGVDTLTGGAGNDFFVFNAPLSAANRDVITDFNQVADTIRLDNAVMPGLGAVGALNPDLFFAGAAAHDANDRVIYNQANGILSYDSNGNAAGGVTLLATLTNKPALFASDFVVI